MKSARTLRLRREEIGELSTDQMRNVGGGNNIVGMHTGIDLNCWCDTTGIGCTVNCTTVIDRLVNVKTGS